MIFGLALVPIVALGGGAVDFARRAEVRMELQNAADAAAIAAARVMQTGELERFEDEEELRHRAEEAARNLFRATLANAGADAAIPPDIQFNGERIVIAADVGVPTAFLTVLGIDELQARVNSEVALPESILVEIAMVLDYSGSMEDGDKYIRMTNAAVSFVDKIADDRSGRTKVGIVPFSEFVYATVRGSDIRGTSPADANDPMSACLLNRDYPYATTDEAPFSALPASRWPQSSEAACDPYVDGNLLVRDLTDDFSELTEAMREMRPTGLTNISLASEMGFQMLSPERPFDTARSYEDENLEKVLILLTDGMQTVPAMGPSGATSTLAADDTTAEVCNNMETAGIRVFAIAYDITDQRVRDLLSGCATAPGNYFEAEDANDISAVFEEIYSQIAESVWLSR